MQSIDSGGTAPSRPPPRQAHDTHTCARCHADTSPPGSDLLIEWTSVLPNQGHEGTAATKPCKRGSTSILPAVSVDCLSVCCFRGRKPMQNKSYVFFFSVSCSSPVGHVYFRMPWLKKKKKTMKRNEPPSFQCNECVKKTNPLCATCEIIYKIHICQVDNAIRTNAQLPCQTSQWKKKNLLIKLTVEKKNLAPCAFLNCSICFIS